MPAIVTRRDASSTGGGPVDDTVQQFNTATQSLCIIFMTVFFALRVYARHFVLNGFTLEDWTCTAAWFLGVCYSVVALVMGSYGGGLHITDVPPSHIVPFNKTVYVTMVMYGPTAFLTKVSLLWIMARVFSPHKKCVIFIYVFMGLMLAYYIPAVIVKVRICDPISRFWLGAAEQGTCLNESAIILADAVISVVSDFIVLILPVPLTMKLQMPLKKRLRVMGILGAGGLACASSVIRLVLILRTGGSSDATWAFMRINMFGNAEIAIGVVCACLPSLTVLVTRAYQQYASHHGTRGTGHELSNVKQSSRSMTARSKYVTFGSDRDVLMENAQDEPKVETSIRSAVPQQGQENGQEGMRIFKTVDVSTSVTSAK